VATNRKAGEMMKHKLQALKKAEKSPTPKPKPMKKRGY